MLTLRKKFFLALLFGGVVLASPSTTLRATELQDQINVENEVLLNLYKKHDFFRQMNANYVSVALNCLRTERYTPELVRSADENLQCKSHYKVFDQIYFEEMKKIRVYRALSNLNYMFANGTSSIDFFSDAIVKSMIPTQIEHIGFKPILWTTEIELPKLDRLSKTEILSGMEIIRYQMSQECTDFSSLSSVKVELQKIKIEGIANVEDFFCKIHTKNPENLKNIFEKITYRDRYAWTQLQIQLKDKIIKSRLPFLSDKSAQGYLNGINKYPFLIFIGGQETFESDLMNAFLKIDNQIHQQNINHEEEVVVLKKLLGGSLENSTSKLDRQSALDLHRKLSSYLDYSFIIDNQLMEYQMSNQFNKEQLLKKLQEQWLTHKARLKVAEFVALVGTNAVCFLPVGRLFTGLRISADLLGLSFKNICLFSIGQPLTAFFVINDHDKLNSIYREFLSDPSGRGRFVSFKEAERAVGSYALSLAFLPIGTGQSKDVILNLWKKKKI